MEGKFQRCNVATKANVHASYGTRTAELVKAADVVLVARSDRGVGRTVGKLTSEKFLSKDMMLKTNTSIIEKPPEFKTAKIEIESLLS